MIRPQGAEATSQSHFRWQETVLNYFIVGKFNGNTITNSRSRVSPLSPSFFPPPSISLTISMSIASRISKPEARYSVHGVRKVAFIRRANFINPRKKNFRSRGNRRGKFLKSTYYRSSERMEKITVFLFVEKYKISSE